MFNALLADKLINIFLARIPAKPLSRFFFFTPPGIGGASLRPPVYPKGKTAQQRYGIQRNFSAISAAGAESFDIWGGKPLKTAVFRGSHIFIQKNQPENRGGAVSAGN
jgi:hypothetical protein